MNKNLKIFKTILINICILFALVLTLELFFIARDKINNNSIITANDEKYIFYDSISKVNKKVAPNFIPRNHIDNLEFLPLSGISDYLVINCNENGDINLDINDLGQIKIKLVISKKLERKDKTPSAAK